MTGKVRKVRGQDGQQDILLKSPDALNLKPSLSGATASSDALNPCLAVQWHQIPDNEKPKTDLFCPDRFFKNLSRLWGWAQNSQNLSGWLDRHSLEHLRLHLSLKTWFSYHTNRNLWHMQGQIFVWICGRVKQVQNFYVWTFFRVKPSSSLFSSGLYQGEFSKSRKFIWTVIRVL